MTPLLDAALGYAQRGWSVIPLKPRMKVPCGPWKSAQEVAATEEEIRQVWERTAKANVGAVMGRVSGVFALDLDPRHGGEEALADLGELPETLTHRTGGGGRHYFFKYPEVGVQSTTIAPGVEIKSDGTLVVLPPSLHPSDELYAVENDAPIAEAPRWLLDGGHADRESIHVEGGRYDRIQTLLRGVEEGGRNEAASVIARAFARWGVPEDVAAEVLGNWNRLNRPPIDQSDPGEKTITQIVKSNYATVRRRGELRSVTFRPEVGGVRALIEAAKRPVEWVVEGLLPVDARALVVGLPGVGKTFVNLQLALSIAAGMDVFGVFPVPKPRTVLAVFGQDSLVNIGRRASWVAAGLGIGLEDVEGRFFHACRPGLVLSDPEHMEWLEQEIVTREIDLLILDAYAYVSSGDENIRRDVLQNLVPLTELQERTGVSISLSHHMRKPGEKDWGIREIFRAIGSVEFASWTNCGITMSAPRSGGAISVGVELWDHPDAPEPFKLYWKRGASGTGPEEAVALVHQNAAGVFELPLLDPKVVEAQHRIVAFLREHGPETKSVVLGTSKRRDAPKIGGSYEHKQLALDDLIESGRVWVDERGAKGHFIHLVEPGVDPNHEAGYGVVSEAASEPDPNYDLELGSEEDLIDGD